MHNPIMPVSNEELTDAVANLWESPPDSKK